MYEISWTATIGHLFNDNGQTIGKHQMKFRLLKDAEQYYNKICKEQEYNPTLKITLSKVSWEVVKSKGY